jgi:hypothetical protein
MIACGSSNPKSERLKETAGSQVIKASIQPTRVSGPAPLAVLFDATATTVTADGVDAFHQLTYEFTFDDERHQSWPVSGKSKNAQSGAPLAAHVFDLPGAYEIRVRASNAAGEYSEASVKVTVQSADVVYTGTKTICVSPSGNFAGCPEKASQLKSLPGSFDGRRVLLRREESFPRIDILHGDDRVIVGAFGTGNQPRVATVYIAEGVPATADFPDEITVMDLDVTNGIFQQGPASRILIYRNHLDDTNSSADNMITIGGALSYFAEQAKGPVPTDKFYHPREIFIVENRVIGSTDDETPSGNFFGEGSRMAFIGNEMGKSAQHTIRLERAHKCVLAHNALRGISSDGNRHALKIHSGGLRNYDDNYAMSGDTWASSQIVVADNLLGDPEDNNHWTAAIRPQNNNSAEGIEDVIVENNRFVHGTATNTDLYLMGRRMTARNNRCTNGELVISHGEPSEYSLPIEWCGPYYIK